MHAERTPNVDVRLATFRKEIFQALAKGEVPAPVTDSTGARPILVVGEHELVSDVFFVAARTGGFANLFVLFDDDIAISSEVIPSPSSLHEDDAEVVDGPIHQDVEIGLLIRTAETAKHGLRVGVALPNQRGEVRNGSRVLQNA